MDLEESRAGIRGRQFSTLLEHHTHDIYRNIPDVTEHTLQYRPSMHHLFMFHIQKTSSRFFDEFLKVSKEVI